MNERYGSHGSLRAKAGRGGDLEALLLEAAQALENNEDCLLYMVARSTEDKDLILVTEAWTSREAHGASLQDEAVKSLIQRGMPLIEQMSTLSEFVPAGRWPEGKPATAV